MLFTDLPRNLRLETIVLKGVRNIWPMANMSLLDKVIKSREAVVEAIEERYAALLAGAEALQVGRLSFDTPDVIRLAGEMQTRWRPPKSLLPRTSELNGSIKDLIEKLSELNKRYFEAQERAKSIVNALQAPAALIEFEDPAHAETSLQVLTYHEPRRVRPCAIDTDPNEILWQAVSLPLWRRELRHLLASGVVWLTILFWAPVSTFIGVLSNVNYLQCYEPFAWVATIPTQLIGVLTGLVPTIALTIILALVPGGLRGTEIVHMST